jgi:hypothetical protein
LRKAVLKKHFLIAFVIKSEKNLNHILFGLGLTNF